MENLFTLDEIDFKKLTAGTALRRINYDQWIRNLAVAIGNSQPNINLLDTLKKRLKYPDESVREHIEWAIKKQYGKINSRVNGLKDKSEK